MSFYEIDNLYDSVKKTDKCIILDLDETLVSTFDDKDLKALKKLRIMDDANLIHLRSRFYFLNINDIDRRGKDNSITECGFTRPHVREFLLFCNRYFKHVIVWSAGCYDYVHEICRYLFNDIDPPTIIYTRDDCENANKLKPLKKMMKDLRLNGEMNLENAIAIDDKTYTFADNIENGILIPPYRVSPTIASIEKDDDTLLKLIDWFQDEKVSNSKNVKILNKNSIFS